MPISMFQLLRPMLFALEPEQAHEVTLRSLEAGIYPRELGQGDIRGSRCGSPASISPIRSASRPASTRMRGADAVLAMGCGLAEVGTVTPQPQPGNPQPRVFRLIRERADQSARLQQRRPRRRAREPAAAPGSRRRDRRCQHRRQQGCQRRPRPADYVAGLEAFSDVASYFMVNISSPNTPGLRDLQAPAALDELLAG